VKKLYIIAGPNGAGKTTASYTILPEIFYCKEFVNADEIARGISPFNPEKVAIQAGKILLSRINKLVDNGISFAVETTLSTKLYLGFIDKAKKNDYEVVLLFLWLNSTELARDRVKTRVKEGGHNIPEDVIIRRYHSGMKNLFNLYMSSVNMWLLVDNSGEKFKFIAEGIEQDLFVRNEILWLETKEKRYDGK